MELQEYFIHHSYSYLHTSYSLYLTSFIVFISHLLSCLVLRLLRSRRSRRTWWRRWGRMLETTARWALPYASSVSFSWSLFQGEISFKKDSELVVFERTKDGDMLKYISCHYCSGVFVLMEKIEENWKKPAKSAGSSPSTLKRLQCNALFIGADCFFAGGWSKVTRRIEGICYYKLYLSL